MPLPTARTEVTDSASEAYRAAVRRLSRRDHSVGELRKALLAKGYSAPSVDGAVARLREKRYLDDTGYAERFARGRMASRGLGKNRIRRDLAQRGLGRETAEAGLKAALAEVSETAIVDAQARKFWASHKDEPRRRLQKLAAFLVRRGFPAGLVWERVRALWPRFQDALHGLDPIDDNGGFLEPGTTSAEGD